VAGFNLALVMRSLFGIGKPRCLQDGLAAVIRGIFDSIVGLWDSFWSRLGVWGGFRRLLTAPNRKTALLAVA